MRIAIVDDNAEDRALLFRQLETYLSRRVLHESITEYETGDDFLADARTSSFSLVFMDVYMKGMNGIETAEKLRAFDKDCLLVFTTSSKEHALDGFRVRAMHYLVKPYSEADVEELIDEIIERHPAPDKHIEIRTTGSHIRLRYRDILYAENYQHRIYIRTTEGKEIIVRQTFSKFTESLQDERFFICTRGVVINLEHALDFTGTAFLMKDGKQITVNRDLTKNARIAFGDYLFKKGGM